MKLKHVKPIIASMAFIAAGAAFANTVKLVNASSDSQNTFALKYQLAYKKDFAHQTLFGPSNTMALDQGKTFTVSIPQKQGYKLSGIVITDVKVKSHGKKQWKKVPSQFTQFAKSGMNSMATDKNHPDGILKFRLKYFPNGHGRLDAEQIGGNNL